MDTAFRMRLRKPEIVTKKGPLVAKHSVAVAPFSSSGAVSPTNGIANGVNCPLKETRCSPMGPGPPLLSHRLRQVSPDSRGGHPAKKNATRGSPKTSPVRNPLRIRSNSPPSQRRIGPTPMRAFGHANASPPTKRTPTPTSPRSRRPISPLRNNPLSPSLTKIPESINQFGTKPKAASFSTTNNRSSSPSGSCKHPASPSGSRPASPRARGASPGSKAPLISEEVLNTRIGRALNARLYLLHQPGPNSFSIGGDSPSHKYKVIIGPQTCSCGHDPYCIHVLFVMVRVLRLPESSPILRAGTLKDFEVEQLLRNWEERRKKAIRARERRTSLGLCGSKDKLVRSNCPRSRKSPPVPPTSPGPIGITDNGSCEEDGQCPICLMTMVEGESLVACEAGCRNFLHHHCMAVWAADRHAQGQPLLCPLCRAPWPSKSQPRTRPNRVVGHSSNFSSGRQSTSQSVFSGASPVMSTSFSGLDNNGKSQEGIFPQPSAMSRSVPPPCSSPRELRRHRLQPDSAYSSSNLERSPVYGYPPTIKDEISAALVNSQTDDLVPLPRTEPIPSEHEHEAASWIYVFGRDLIACLFSRDWAVRETGLRRLAHEVVKALYWDYLITSEQIKQKVIHCCFHILAQVANDPVYKVYIACLRCLRVLLSLLCPTEAKEVCAVQELLRPLLYTIMMKCADGNRRTSQISIDSIVELCRGQNGELALGAQSNGANDAISLGGMNFVLSCILDSSSSSQVPWQWHLGRLSVLDRLLDEYPEEFQLHTVELNTTESGYKLQHYDRLMTVVEFAFKALGSNHATVVKLARRIYICGARMAIAEPAVFRQICDMLSKLDVSLQMRLKRRLKMMQEGGALGERRCSLARLGQKLSLTPVETRLARSISHSPSRVFSFLRSSSQSPARPSPPISKSPLKDDPTPIKPIRRPNHLPLDSLDAKFKAKQNKLRLYHKSKSKHEIPLAVHQTVSHPPPVPPCSPVPSRKKSQKHAKQMPSPLIPNPWSCSNFDDADLSPQTPVTNHDLPKYSFKSAISSPTTPSAPSSTPVREYFTKCRLRCCSSDQSGPRIPGLHLIPRYLDGTATSEELVVEGEHYLEGFHWVKGPLLGTGAFSSCYQARDIDTGTLMAVKQLSVCRNSEEDQERVETTVEEEILMMAKLDHANVVRLLGATRIGSSFSVFSEWMAGGSVAGMLEKYGSFSENVIVRYTFQIFSGLSYLHDNMILHRDLKGANLLVDSTGHELRIGDFGTAAKLASKATISGEFKGQLLGTIAFMAPEVLRGDDYGRACDLWSVGCCIVEMATSKPPWGAEYVSNQYKLMFRIATSLEPPIVPDSLSDGVREVALNCLKLNSEERPTAKQFLQHSIFDNLPP